MKISWIPDVYLPLNSLDQLGKGAFPSSIFLITLSSSQQGSGFNGSRRAALQNFPSDLIH